MANTKDKIVLVEATKAVSLHNTDTKLMTERLKIINKISGIIKNQLEDGLDYGIVPGTKKPVLFKSGALKIKMLYGLQDNYTIIDKHKGLNQADAYEEYYTITCKLTTFKDGQEIAEGIGHTSTLEKGKKNTPANTLLKMAKKRALVDAVISIAALSKIFTQDKDEYNPLTTENAKYYMTEFDRLKVFSAIYKLLKPDYRKLGKKELTTFKSKSKAFISDLIKKLEIPQILDPKFNLRDKEKLLQVINEDVKTKEVKNG